MSADFSRSMRLALRSLVRHPGSSALATIIIALGVGVNTAVFAIVDALLVRSPSEIAEPGALVRIGRLMADGGMETMAYPDYAYVRDNARTLGAVAAFDGRVTPVMLAGEREPEQIDATFVSGNFFAVLGVGSRAGRVLTAADDGSEAAAVNAVISDGLWERRFARDRAVLGKTITVNGHAFTVVGVAPVAFRGLDVDAPPVDLWLPIWARPRVAGRPVADLVRTAGYFHGFAVAVGRIAPNGTLASIRSELRTLGARLAADYAENRGTGVWVTDHASLDPRTRAAVVSVARLLLGVTGVVLLVACANLANLQLVRATTRAREIAVRLALGASRWQLVRQLLAESLALSAVGAAAGLVTASWTARLLVPLLPAGGASLALDWRGFVFALALALVTGLASGLAPALRATRPDLAGTLRRGIGAMEGRSRLRGALVVIQVALSFVLVFGAALFVRSLDGVRRVPLGFDPSRTLVVVLDLRPYGYDEPRGRAFHAALLERVRAIPGVELAALGAITPLSGARRSGTLVVDGVAPPPGGEGFSVDQNLVSSDFFAALRIPIVRGRPFAPGDDAAAPRVAVVNETMARRYWNGAALGRRLRRAGDSTWIEVVGVARDGSYTEVGVPAQPFIFLSSAQRYDARLRLFVRSAGEPAELTASVREVIRSLDARVVVQAARTLESVHADAIRRFTTNASLLTALGALALLLAAVGLYGVLAFVVGQRTREIGVRMALGARAGHVVRRVTADGMALVALGLVVGVPLALVVGRFVSHLLFGIRPVDPASLVAAAAMLLAAALLASWAPARRASRVDPMVAMRE